MINGMNDHIGHLLAVDERKPGRRPSHVNTIPFMDDLVDEDGVLTIGIPRHMGSFAMS